MKRIRIVGLCLMAVFAFSAMAASSASAAPGLLLARIAGGGSVAGVTFLSLGLLALLTTHGGSLIDCTHVLNHGLFLSATLGDLLIRFSNCTTVVNGKTESCNSEGESAGNIHLPLATTLFHLGLAHLTIEVGRIPAALILLNKDVKFTCAGIAKILVLGAVIGALQLDPSEKPLPLNTPFANAILNFEQTAHGLQHLRLFLFEDLLNSYDLHSITTVLTEGPVELSAEVALALLDLFRLSNGVHVNIELFEDGK